jgi:glycosyltransferase involved in cell wall biosynthesis
MRPTRVIHCFRAPIGGLFRHVRDLAGAQAGAGFEVGLICDSLTGDHAANDALDTLEKACALGIRRIPMSRTISPGDLHAVREVAMVMADVDADVIHGHGAKGGAYARLATGRGHAVAIYTPHGGSLHYSAISPSGFVFLALERLLAQRTGGLVFESRFSRDTYVSKIGRPGCPVRIIPNGLAAEEFLPVANASDAADFVFVGELRHLKGVDLLLRALAAIRAERPVTAVIVGDGPDAAAFRALTDSLGLSASVGFPGAIPARAAFALGRCLVVPSRKESFPYIVLEAAAARKPMIAANVGGIPEIFGPAARTLVRPDSVEDLTAAMRACLDAPEIMRQRAEELALRVGSEFSLERMVAAVNGFYGECTEAAHGRTDGAPAMAHPAE